MCISSSRRWVRKLIVALLTATPYRADETQLDLVSTAQLAVLGFQFGLGQVFVSVN